jgi:hypothetical protein
LCEGWGVGDAISGIAGWANVDEGNTSNPRGVFNLRLVSFVSTSATATSVVDLFNPANGVSILRVTHSYVPEPLSPSLYRVNVTIQNLTASNVQLRYRRTIDWDIEPTAFDEYVTILKGTSPFLITTTNNGFDTPNPLSPPAPLADRPASGTFIDWPLGAPQDPNTPGDDTVTVLDQGAVFDFNFGLLAPGGMRSFTTFYGAAGTEAQMVAAASTVGMEAYSLGQPVLRDPTDPNDLPRPLDSNNNGYPDSAENGAPNTFLFGFGAIGGTPIDVDADDDGVQDANDNCVNTPNPGQ